MSLSPLSNEILHATLNAYSLNKTVTLKAEFDYQLFEQQESARQIQLQKDLRFREQVAQSIFGCTGFSAPVVYDTIMSNK